MVGGGFDRGLRLRTCVQSLKRSLKSCSHARVLSFGILLKSLTCGTLHRQVPAGYLSKVNCHYSYGAAGAASQGTAATTTAVATGHRLLSFQEWQGQERAMRSEAESLPFKKILRLGVADLMCRKNDRGAPATTTVLSAGVGDDDGGGPAIAASDDEGGGRGGGGGGGSSCCLRHSDGGMASLSRTLAEKLAAGLITADEHDHIIKVSIEATEALAADNAEAKATSKARAGCQQDAEARTEFAARKDMTPSNSSAESISIASIPDDGDNGELQLGGRRLFADEGGDAGGSKECGALDGGGGGYVNVDVDVDDDLFLAAAADAMLLTPDQVHYFSSTSSNVAAEAITQSPVSPPMNPHSFDAMFPAAAGGVRGDSTREDCTHGDGDGVKRTTNFTKCVLYTGKRQCGALNGGDECTLCIGRGNLLDSVSKCFICCGKGSYTNTANVEIPCPQCRGQSYREGTFSKCYMCEGDGYFTNTAKHSQTTEGCGDDGDQNDAGSIGSVAAGDIGSSRVCRGQDDDDDDGSSTDSRSGSAAGGNERSGGGGGGGSGGSGGSNNENVEAAYAYPLAPELASTSLKLVRQAGQSSMPIVRSDQRAVQAAVRAMARAGISQEAYETRIADLVGFGFDPVKAALCLQHTDGDIAEAMALVLYTSSQILKKKVFFC